MRKAKTQPVDVLDTLLRSQAVRQFQVQMMLQNPRIAGAQPTELKVKLGFEPLPQSDYDYFAQSEAKYNAL